MTLGLGRAALTELCNFVNCPDMGFQQSDGNLLKLLRLSKLARLRLTDMTHGPFLGGACGLYYKHIMIVNDNSKVVSKRRSKLWHHLRA
jgi:hypothetical protein